MKVIRSRSFVAGKPWGALDIASMNGVSVRLHWTDAPYKWHVNDGEEVFAVLDGVVEMHYRENGEEKIAELEAGDIFFAGIGCEHVAHPRGAARILVIETEGSI
ncbi:MAG TPA: cupin [Noviherbaspirillum sp.]|uniref:cupin n=1 Tax=Noviherbaspirillum sp. TaxID=1926288 RepID=UPI002B4A0950|nr:cupin [Noviherbaspirillum sp.]HJV87185.1 cupin [Noviherbaspirillum sp.]